MGFMNRRNAALGWAAWKLGKRAMKKKAADAVPKIDTEAKRPNKSAIAVAVATLTGVLFFWRKRGDDPPPSP